MFSSACTIEFSRFQLCAERGRFLRHTQVAIRFFFLKKRSVVRAPNFYIIYSQIFVKKLCTSAEKPYMKVTVHFLLCKHADCVEHMQNALVRMHKLQCVAVCCSALQCVAVWCSVVQCVAVSCSVLQCHTSAQAQILARNRHT